MGDMIGGEKPSSPSNLSSPTLRKHGRAAAEHCFRRCYETWPWLDERYGERGRQHVAQDAYWHLEHLDEALEADEPRIFADYVDWITGLLEARGIGPEQLTGAFHFLAEALEAAECPASEEDHRRALVALLRDNQARLLPRVPATQPGGAGGISVQASSLDFFERLVKFDRKGALALVADYLDRRGDVLGLYDEVLGPALVHTGHEWECGHISVAHEHYISEVALELISRYGPGVWAEAREGAPVVVACCVPRERHNIGIRMVADTLRSEGMIVHLLGESLPAHALLDLLGGVGADLLCLSCALDVHLPDAANLIALARQARPGLRVAVGGAAIRGRSEEARALLGADLTAADVGAVRRSLPGWLRSPAPPCDANRRVDSPEAAAESGSQRI